MTAAIKRARKTPFEKLPETDSRDRVNGDGLILGMAVSMAAPFVDAFCFNRSWFTGFGL
jgi:hypothetical protein